MEKAKFVVENISNPRGKSFSNEDIKQWILDIKTWLAKNLKSQATIAGATEIELETLRKQLKFVPESLEILLSAQNGQLQLLETYKTLSSKEILDSCEEYKIYGYWSNNYIPIAKDIDGALLIIQVDKDNKTEKGIIAWNRDNGVLEEINENLGFYLENYSTGLLKKKYEYVEGVGIIENSN